MTQSTPEDEQIVIIDIGEAYTKVGFAGDEQPVIFPTMTGKEKYKSVMADVDTKDQYVGEDCMRMRGVLKITYPFNRGAIMDWDSYYSVLTHIFYNVLRTDPSKVKVIYPENALTPLDTKKYITRLFFETYRVRSVYIANAPVMALFSAGLTTGMLVESGEGLTWIVPIIDGEVVTHAVQKLTLSGKDVSEYLRTLLLGYGVNITSTAQKEILRDIKEKTCFIALNPEEVAKHNKDITSYILPDGESVKFPMSVRVNAPEILFHPELLGYNVSNIAQAIINSLSKLDKQYWRTMLKSIVLSGGNTMFQGLNFRLEEELKQLLPQLGPLPKPSISRKSLEKPRMINVDTPTKMMDTCPKCGERVNLATTKICSKCGYIFGATTINIPSDFEYPNKCPHCKKKLEGKSSFCPFCGGKIVPIPLNSPKKFGSEEFIPKIKDLQAIKATEFEEDTFADDGGDIIKIVLPAKRNTAIFNGASILGSIPSAQKLFITYEKYLENPDTIGLDFSQLL
ncbi:MAG: rod shape-determining protein [Candidatus Lokiarchaeota archaeon]|nr:rod shape-determining protein [Candidatus Lokiarchaeota archaeon]